MKKLYVVYDSKTEQYLPPITHSAKGEAIRSFSDAINQEGTLFNNHPADFTLFEVGEYSPEDGSFYIYEAKVTLGNGLDFQTPVE